MVSGHNGADKVVEDCRINDVGFLIGKKIATRIGTEMYGKSLPCFRRRTASSHLDELNKKQMCIIIVTNVVCTNKKRKRKENEKYMEHAPVHAGTKLR
jgi:hypothetical protein